MNKYILIGIPLLCGAIIGTTITLSIPKSHADTIEIQTDPNQPSHTSVSSSPGIQIVDPTVAPTATPTNPTTEPTIMPTNAPQTQNSPSQPSPCGN